MLRPWLNSFLALCLSLTPAAAQEFTFNQQVNVFPQIFRGTCTVNDAATTSPVTQSDVTIPGVSDGESVIVYVGIIAEDAATFNATAMTVDGAAATLVVDEAATGIVDTGFWRIGPIVNAGTVSITVSYTESITSSGVCVWAAKNLFEAPVVDFVVDDDTASAALVLSTTTTFQGGYLLCVSNSSGTTDSTTWALVTEREDTQSAEFDYSTADGLGTGASMSTTADWSGTTDASGACIVIR